MTRWQIDQHARVLNAWRAQQDQLDPAWAGAASLNDYALRLRPEQARSLLAELDAVLNRWMDEHPVDAGPETGDLVSVLLDIVPLKEWPR
jgi:hypothetical protein